MDDFDYNGDWDAPLTGLPFSPLVAPLVQHSGVPTMEPPEMQPAEFKDQDPRHPDYASFGRRCEDAAMTLMCTPDLASVSLRNHPLTMMANRNAALPPPIPTDQESIARFREVWATISVTHGRPPPSLTKSMDISVADANGTVYVGADNERRGRKRQRKAYVSL